MTPNTEDFAAAYLMGYTQGIADAGATLIGVAAADLGPDHPAVARMVERVRDLAVRHPDTHT